MCAAAQHRRFLRPIAFMVFVVLCALASCEKPRSSGTQLTDIDLESVITKHRLRTSVAEGWKAEAWLWASSQSGYYPVDINVRLTPTDQEVKSMPPVAVDLAVLRKGENVPLRQASLKAEWQECAKMKKRFEMSYENGRYGKSVNFPPKESCWETAFADPFKSNRRSSGGVPFELGEYVLAITIAIDGGPRFHFDDLQINILKGYEPPNTE